MSQPPARRSPRPGGNQPRPARARPSREGARAVAPEPQPGTQSIALWQQLAGAAAALQAIRGGKSGTAALAAVDAALRPGVQALLFQVLRQLGRAEALRRQLAARTPPPAAEASPSRPSRPAASSRGAGATRSRPECRARVRGGWRDGTHHRHLRGTRWLPDLRQPNAASLSRSHVLTLV